MDRKKEIVLSQRQKEAIDLILKDLVEMIKDHQVIDYGNHSLKNMLWREIFYRKTLGAEDEEKTNDLLWNYIDIVKDSVKDSKIDLDEIFNFMEDKLLELELLWEEEEKKRKKQGEISFKIEKLWIEREKNNAQLARYYKLRESLELEEEEKLEKEWNTTPKSIREIKKSVTENIEKRKQLEAKKEEVNLELKKLKNAQRLIWEKKEEYCSRFDEYAHDLDKLEGKLDNLCIKLQKDCEEGEKNLSLMLIEFSGNIQKKVKVSQNIIKKH